MNYLTTNNLTAQEVVPPLDSLLTEEIGSLAINISNPLDTRGKIGVDALQYGRYYNTFFASGFAGLVILLGLLVFIVVKKYQRTNPIGIMFNLLII